VASIHPVRAIRLFGRYFKVGAMNELQYRANFAAQLLQSGIALATGLAVLGLVFAQTQSLAGWSQPELLAVMGVHMLMGGFVWTFIDPNMQRLITDVREGTLDFVLTKPVDSQLLVTVREVRIWNAVDIVIGLVVLGVAIVQMGGRIGPIEAGAFVVALVLGASMIYCFWMILTTSAFWIVRMDEIHELFEGVFQAGRWPVTIYPGWLRIGLTFLVPIAFAVTVPAQALSSRLDAGTLALAAAFAVALLAFTRWFWFFGLRNYSGASA
jgi:ABC-2 type transport system permease protein